MSEATAVDFEDFIFLLQGAEMARRHGLRKRKNLPGWSNGAASCSRPLLVIGDSKTRCQFVEPTFVVDSRTKSACGSGQESVRLETPRLMARPIRSEARGVGKRDTTRDWAATSS